MSKPFNSKLNVYKPLKASKSVNKVSSKRKKLLPAYKKLISELGKRCHNMSELSGAIPDWQTGGKVEPHHINGRTGGLFTNPFNIIMLTRTEHDIEEGNNRLIKPHSKKVLLKLVRDKRLKQGYLE